MHLLHRSLSYLIVLLILFCLAFLYAFFNLRAGRSLFGTSLGYATEAWMVMVLSIIGVIKAVFDLHRRSLRQFALEWPLEADFGPGER